MPRYNEYVLLYNAPFRGTMEMAAMILARSVLAEGNDGTETHELRKRLARIMLRLDPGDRDTIIFQLSLILAMATGMSTKVVNATGVVSPTAWTDADFDTVARDHWTNVAELMLPTVAV